MSVSPWTVVVPAEDRVSPNPVMKGPDALGRETEPVEVLVPLISEMETETGSGKVLERAAMVGRTSVVMLTIWVVVQVLAALWQLFSRQDEISR